MKFFCAFNAALIRFFDVFISAFVLLLLSPLFLIVLLLVYLEDFDGPLFSAKRVGRGGKFFTMFKIRSMSNKTSISFVSTSDSDPRITKVGRFVRRYKLDELSQFVNVLLGSMSIVGPRPNVQSDVNLYNSFEKQLLLVSPGITDFASIVFSDESKILSRSSDPDADYNLLIRPWKSRLAYVYAVNRNPFLYFFLIILTATSLFSRSLALRVTFFLLICCRVHPVVCNFALRSSPVLSNIVSPPICERDVFYFS